MKNAGNDLPLPAHIYSVLVDSKTSDTGLFFMLGAIWHLLFVADVDWYAA